MMNDDESVHGKFTRIILRWRDVEKIAIYYNLSLDCVTGSKIHNTNDGINSY